MIDDDVTTIEQDGYMVDAETGEVIAVCGDDAETFAQEFGPEQIEAVLRRRMAAEARIAAVQAQARAVADNAARIVARERARLDWLDRRYSGEAEAYLQRVLTGKRRSLDTVYGRLGLRKTPGSIRVSDPESALPWAQINAPDAVVVKLSVAVSRLKGREAELPAAFEVTPPAERVYWQTGVKAAEVGDAAE